jgi:hypothetical protein
VASTADDVTPISDCCRTQTAREQPEWTTYQEHPTPVWQTPRNEDTGTNPTVTRVEEVPRDECVATGGQVTGCDAGKLQAHPLEVFRFLEFN